MNKFKLLRTVSTIALIFFATTVYSKDIPESTWSGIYGQIESIQAIEAGLVSVFKTHTYEGHASKCSGGRQFIVRIQDPNYDVKAKVLIAAYLAGHKMSPYWTGNNGCFAHIIKIQIKR